MMPPDTETLLSKVAVTVALAEAFWDISTFNPDTDTTVVEAGIPEPVMVCPAPMSVLIAPSTTVELPLVVVTESVNTPIFDIVVPEISPIKTGVSAISSIELRF